ncbi:MAG TPA: hypothetical protein VD886_06945, partial [Herpetosiphonaceae bacterium]|nr:hypothetical protein [Herpetosiphonaceae bacterium]
LALAGAGGLLILSRVGLRGLQAIDAWLGGLAGGSLPAPDPEFARLRYKRLAAPLEAVVFARPWVWPALLGLGLLLRPAAARARAARPRRELLWVLPALLAALAVGGWMRFGPLSSAERAIAWTLDYDEGVYVSAARLWLQGHPPHRDLWLAHPPGGIALIAPAVALGDSGAAALINARRFTVALDLLAALLLLWVGAELGGWGAGGLAAGLYLIDGTVALNSTHVWLETAVNVWSLAALGCLLRGLRGNRPRWLLAAGGLAALAIATKYIGVATLLALLAGLALGRRWRALGLVALGAAGAGLALALVALWFGWGNVIRQTLITQLLRQPQSITVPERTELLINVPASMLTAVAAALGAGSLALARRARPEWALVGLWLCSTLWLIGSSPSFYGHYLTQLMPPLALLGGGIALGWREAGRRMRIAIGLGALLLAPVFAPPQTRVIPDTPSHNLVASAAAIKARTPEGQPLLSFEALYNLLSDRPFVRAPDGLLLIDYFMHRRGMAVDWDANVWSDVWRALVRREALPGVAENPVDALLRQAPAAVFDATRAPTEVGQRVLLASEYGQYPLSRATLYQRLPAPRQFTLQSLRVRGMLVPQAAEAGERLPVTIYWQMLRAEAITPTLSLQLIDGDNRKWGQVDKPIGPEGAPFWAWQAGPKVYEELIEVPVDPATPPGDYQLLFVLYDPATGQPWELTQDDGQVAPAARVIERVSVGEP